MPLRERLRPIQHRALCRPATGLDADKAFYDERRVVGETIGSFGFRHPTLIVVVGEGRPSKTSGSGQHEGVGGRPSPTMTVATDKSTSVGFIAPQVLIADP